MTNSGRHISVLGSNQTRYATSSLRNRKFSAWLLFIAMLILAILNDSSVWFLTIPDFSSGLVMQGTLSINAKKRKIDRTLSLTNDPITTRFTCRIRPNRGGDCLSGFNTEQLKLLEGKNAKIYFYKVRIAGIFQENRLLQLEINNEVITSYQDQTTAYLKSKRHHLYLFSIICIVSLIVLILIYLSDVPEFNKD